MPALGSSIIHKSGKKIAPKAPARRPAAINSTQLAARESVERTSQSETIQQPAKSTDLALQLPDPHVGTSAWETEPTQRESDHGRKILREVYAPGENTTIQASARPPDASPRQPPGQSQLPATAKTTDVISYVSDISQSRPPTAPSNHTSQSLFPAPSAQDLGEVPPGPPPESSPTPPVVPLTASSADQLARGTQPEAVHEDAPPAKRRKLRSDGTAKLLTSRRTPSVQKTVPLSSAEAINDTSATTDDLQIDDARGEPVQPALATKSQSKGQSKHQRKAAGAGAEADSARALTQSGKNNEKTAKVSKSRRAKTVTNRRRLQDAAAEIVADAVEGTTAKRKGRRSAREREATPEEAENETITPGMVKMADLCKDTRKGKL